MTTQTRTRGPSKERIKQVVELLRELDLGDRGFDIRADGVTVYPPNAGGVSAYDKWKAQERAEDQNRDRPSRRP